MDELLAQSGQSQQGQPQGQPQQGQASMDALLAQSGQQGPTQPYKPAESGVPAMGYTGFEPAGETEEQIQAGMRGTAAIPVGAAKGAVSTAAGATQFVTGLPTRDLTHKWTESKPQQEAQKVGQTLGYGGETLAEFMLGDEALKGLALGERLEITAKVMKTFQKSPRLMRALKIGAEALQTGARTGTVGATQELARTGDIGKAAETGAITGAAGAVVSAVPEVAKAVTEPAAEVAEVPKPSLSETGQTLKEEGQRIFKEDVRAQKAAKDAALKQPEYALDMREGSETHTQLQNLHDQLKDDVLSGKVSPEAADSVDKTLKGLLKKPPTEDQFTEIMDDPENPGKKIKVFDNEAFDRAQEKYEQDAIHNGKDVNANLNKIKKAVDADEAARNRGVPGKSEAYNYHVQAKNLYQNAAMDQAGDAGQDWKDANLKLQETMKRQGRAQYKGVKGGPARSMFKAETPEQSATRFMGFDGTQTKEALAGMDKNVIQKTREGVWNRLVDKNTESIPQAGKTPQVDWKGVEKDFKQYIDKGGAQELYGDELESRIKTIQDNLAKVRRKEMMTKAAKWTASRLGAGAVLGAGYEVGKEILK